MAYPMSISETVSQMAQQPSTTLGWDVVVNYTESDINNLLSETFKDGSKEQITEIKCEIELPDVLNPTNYITVHYDFKLAAPLLTFNSRNAQGPSCNLTLPIVGGTVQAEGGEAVTIYPGRYSLVLGTLKLATAKGAADPDTISYDKSFVIPDEGSQQGCVVIDLPTSADLTVNIDIDENSSVSSIPIIDSYTPNVSLAIQKLLRVDYQDIRYEIARVNGTTPPSGSIQLKPKAFRFDAFLPSESSQPDDAGILTIFIQTRDINYGRESELATEWERQWRTALACSPIPEDHTASIIFSKDMIYEIMIKPALDAKEFPGTLQDTVGSLKVEVETGAHVYRDELNKVANNTRYHADSVNMDLPPLELILSEQSGSAAYSVSWEFDYKCGWWFQVIIGQNPPFRRGTVKATHTVPKDDTVPVNAVTFLDDYSFQLDCSISKDDWGAVFVADDENYWYDWTKSDMLPDWVTSLSVDLPGFELSLQSMNFFLTTNLLFPDDKQVIDIDKKSGLHIPADLYLVGNIKAA